MRTIEYPYAQQLWAPRTAFARASTVVRRDDIAGVAVSAVGRQRRVSACRLAIALLIVAGADAGAQAAERTTIGQLLGGRADTVEVSHFSGGRLGQSGARLLLVRGASEFATGTLVHSQTYNRVPIIGGGPQLVECTRTFRVAVPDTLLGRLLAAIDSTAVDSGSAPRMPTTVTDHYSTATMRLAGAHGSVTVRDARTVIVPGAGWHVPQRGAWTGPRQRTPPNDRTTLVAAWEALAPHLLSDRLRALAESCER